MAPLGLDRARDVDVWTYARQSGFTIMTKDEDMSDRTTLRGAPPHIVWLRLGNCSTADVAAALEGAAEAINALSSNTSVGTLILRPSW